LNPGDPDRVPFVDLGRTWGEIRAEVLAATDRVASHGDFILGRELDRFEAELAAYCGAREAVGVSSGTAALELALRALEVGPDSEVVTVANTYIATVEAIAATGARPVFVDVDPDTNCMEPALLAGALTPRTAAVIPVHLYGRPAPVGDVLHVCADRGIHVVEDACQAHGARLDGKPAGSLGVAGAFSFYPTKNLGAFGDGGAVVTDDPAVAAIVRSLRRHGTVADDPNHHVRAGGGTERLDNLQAAILRLKLAALERVNEERRATADRYRHLLGSLPVELPPGDPPDGRHVYHLFVVELDERDRVRRALFEAGVDTAIHYPTPCHLQPGWRFLGYGAGDLPVTERKAARILSLPLFAGIRPDEQERVADALADALQSG
jgi:dTDP-4-amino-4,6-dideoxygalactose transaminase